MKAVVTKSFIFSLLFFVICIISLIIYISQQLNLYNQLIFPNVYVNNFKYSGLNKIQLYESFENKNSILKKIELTLKYSDKTATFSGETILLAYDPSIIWQQTYSIGRSDNFWTRSYQQITLILNIERYDFFYRPSYNVDKINEFLLQLEDENNIPAENALFEIKQDKVVAFKIEKAGQQIDSKKVIGQIEEYLNNINLKHPSNEKKIFLIEKTTVEPDIKLSSINNYGIIEKIGEGKSDYRGSTQKERLHNIDLAASKLHGMLIKSNETFSFNNALGDVSSTTGFKQAYIIMQGKTVLGDGGGVCQVSTTLFRAALNTGLPIVERHAHAYRVHYYENDAKPGLDATVFAPGVDLKIINDTPGYILIQAYNDTKNQILTFSFYGKKDGRKIEISPIRIWDVTAPQEPLYQDDPTLPKGTVKQVEHSSPGTKASFHYKVTNNGKITQDNDIISNYKPWRAVYLVGTKE